MPTADTLVRIALVGVILGYAAATLLLACRRRQAGIAAFLAAWFVNTGVWLANGIACGQPPFGNMHHVLAFVGICFFPLYIVVSKRYTLSWVGPYVAAAAVFAAVGAAVMEPGLNWRRVPALQSPWFVPHVTAYMLSYSLAAVAFLLTAVGWTGTRLARFRGSDEAPAENAPDYAAASYEILRIGFPFMTFGMLSGALWAEEAWGVYWSWDAKETWSLITWMLYIIYFHCRCHARLKRHAQWVQAVAFAALLITFLAVNLLPRLGSVLHSYT